MSNNFLFPPRPAPLFTPDLLLMRRDPFYAQVASPYAFAALLATDDRSKGRPGHSVAAPLTLLWGLGARGSGQGGGKNVGRVKGQGSRNSVHNGRFERLSCLFIGGRWRMLFPLGELWTVVILSTL